MAQTGTARFTCSGCGRTYRWKLELAGKKVKCGCGHVMIAPEPTAEAVEVQQEEEDLYDLAPDAESKPKAKHKLPESGSDCPACGQALVQGAILCVQCGYDLQNGTKIVSDAIKKSKPATTAPAKPSSPVVPYGRPTPSKNSEVDENALGGPVWKEIFVPLGILVVGLIVQVGLASNWHVGDVSDYIKPLGIRLAINLVLSIVGILLVAKFMEIGFGSPGPMILKLAAIALAVPGIAQVLGQMVGHDSPFVAMMSATVLETPLGVVLFWWLFDIDFGEAFYCVIVIWLVNEWAVTFLLAMMLGDMG